MSHRPTQGPPPRQASELADVGWRSFSETPGGAQATCQPSLCDQVIHVTELPPPGNLSDLAAHIFISA